MKKQVNFIIFVLIIMLLLSSCQSVYEMPVVTTGPAEGFEIDPDQEYYTMGYPYRGGDTANGLLYEGCWIFIEERPTIGQIGTKSQSGVIVPVYGETTVKRVVKYNPVTGTISSPCLSPSCNHSPGSDCPMLFPYIEEIKHNFSFRGIFGDWLVIWTNISDDEFQMIYQETIYNLKTGEVRQVFNDELGSEVLVRWSNGSYYDGKYYRIKKVLDYSGTGYKPGQEGESIRNYTPFTRQFLYEYDFDSDSNKELFEIPTGYNLGKVSNERIYFANDLEEYISFNKDGTDKRREKAMDGMGVSNLVGTYTINRKTNGYDVHDLKSGEQKEVIFDISLKGKVCVTEKGILASHQTKYDEWKNFSAKEYREKNPGASTKEVNAAAKKTLADGTAQIWLCGYMGEDPHVIFELKNAMIETIAAQGDYIFALLNRYDPETGEEISNGRAVINIKTGEISEIPYLDIVVPDEYLN